MTVNAKNTKSSTVVNIEQGFANAGIEVFFDAENPKVGQVAQLVAEGKLPNMTADQACRH